MNINYMQSFISMHNSLYVMLRIIALILIVNLAFLGAILVLLTYMLL